jgi:hypothetical protein
VEDLVGLGRDWSVGDGVGSQRLAVFQSWGAVSTRVGALVLDGNPAGQKHKNAALVAVLGRTLKLSAGVLENRLCAQ